MTQTEKRESLTRMLRVSDPKQNYFIGTDQITGKRFALYECAKPGSLNVKSNFMTFKQMECFFLWIKRSKKQNFKYLKN